MTAGIPERETQEHLKRLTVLFVEDGRASRELRSAFLSRLVGVLVTAINGAEGLDAWRQHKPDIIITDIQMPVMDGLAMLQEIRSVDRAVPVIILSAFEEPEYLKQSIDLGVSGYVVKPVGVSRFTEALLKCAQGLLLEKKNHLAQVALASNFRFLQKLTDVIPGLLAYWNTELRCSFSNCTYNEWFGKTVEQMRGIHIRDLMGEKLYLISEAHITAALQGVAHSFERSMIKTDGSIGHTTVHYIPDMFEDEVQGFLVMITDVTERKQAEKALQERNAIISRLVVTDELTGLNNRRYFNESFAKAVSAARRHKLPLSLVSIDLDHFKKVNDTFGHSVGDLVLKEFSTLLNMMVRIEDVACRLGGEEFMVLLPNTNAEGAVALAERIRCSFERLPRTATPVVTASFGVAQLQEREDEDALMRRVDDALYQAKKEGRNRVVAACDVALS